VTSPISITQNVISTNFNLSQTKLNIKHLICAIWSMMFCL